MKSQLKENSLRVRQAVNSAIRGKSPIDFSQYKNGVVMASIGVYIPIEHEPDMIYYDDFSICYVSDVVQYDTSGVLRNGMHCRIDLKTVQWAHRKLDELYVMRKMTGEIS